MNRYTKQIEQLDRMVNATNHMLRSLRRRDDAVSKAHIESTKQWGKEYRRFRRNLEKLQRPEIEAFDELAHYGAQAMDRVRMRRPGLSVCGYRVMVLEARDRRYRRAIRAALRQRKRLGTDKGLFGSAYRRMLKTQRNGY